jgi:hypothetical protein
MIEPLKGLPFFIQEFSRLVDVYNPTGLSVRRR